jgi:hypothetical protein
MARDEAAAVACECIKAMITNCGYHLHDLPGNAEAWFKSHRERDKQAALYEAKRELRKLDFKPSEVRTAECRKQEGFEPTPQKQRELNQIEAQWKVRLQAAQAKVEAIHKSDPMDLKHGLY